MKTQDLIVLLKICLSTNKAWKYADLARELTISQSEVFQAVERCRMAGLIDETKRLVNRARLLEFLLHGLRYVFPPVLKGHGAGIPLFFEDILIAEGKELQQQVYVWMNESGTATGEAIEPLHKSIPKAIKTDRLLHEALAYVEILRFQESPLRGWATTKIRSLLSAGTSQQQTSPTDEGAPTAANSATKQAILEAAAKVCALHGFESASLKDIATEAGITPAMVIYHFGGKRSLILDLVRSQLQDVGQVIGRIMMLGSGIQETHMRQSFSAFLDMLHANSDFYRINLWTLSDNEPDMNDVIRGPFTFMVENIGEHLQRISGGQGEVDKFCRGLMFITLTHLFAILRWTYLSRIQSDASMKEILERCRVILDDSFLTPLLRKADFGLKAH